MYCENFARSLGVEMGGSPRVSRVAVVFCVGISLGLCMSAVDMVFWSMLVYSPGTCFPCPMAMFLRMWSISTGATCWGHRSQHLRQLMQVQMMSELIISSMKPRLRRTVILCGSSSRSLCASQPEVHLPHWKQ